MPLDIYTAHPRYTGPCYTSSIVVMPIRDGLPIYYMPDIPCLIYRPKRPDPSWVVCKSVCTLICICHTWFQYRQVLPPIHRSQCFANNTIYIY